jgi:hypothetical protein
VELNFRDKVLAKFLLYLAMSMEGKRYHIQHSLLARESLFKKLEEYKEEKKSI